MTLQRLSQFPNRLADLDIRHIKSAFPKPTLLSIEGRRPEPLFVSTLLHGNEPTSFVVLQDLARRFANTAPPRTLMIFVGNVDATAAGARHLDSQPDFNRIWAGGVGPEFDLAREVITAARDARPFASIDIHNNTGTNPFYGCINTMRPENLGLAALFARVAVYYRNPPTTQSMAFAQFCPAITIECGRVGNPIGTERAISFVNDVLHLDHLPTRVPPEQDLALYETIGRVVIESKVRFSFTDATADLLLRADLDEKNFSDLSPGEAWGTSTLTRNPLRVLDEFDREHVEEFFDYSSGTIRLRRPVTPSMLTLREDIIRQDCLGYLMTRLPLHDASNEGSQT